MEKKDYMVLILAVAVIGLGIWQHFDKDNADAQGYASDLVILLIQQEIADAREAGDVEREADLQRLLDYLLSQRKAE